MDLGFEDPKFRQILLRNERTFVSRGVGKKTHDSGERERERSR